MARASRQPAIDAFRDAWTAYLGDIDAHWSGAIAGDDAEELHDLRIALRRTRALLRYGKGVVSDDDRRRFDARFRELTTVTTSARDLDVAVAAIGSAAAAQPELTPALDELQRRQAEAHRRVAETLQAPESAALLATWRAWLAEPPTAPAPRAGTPVGALVRRRLRRARRRLERGVRIDTPEARHQWRKQAKNMRYFVETFAELFDRRAVKRLRRDLVRAQDDLGHARDAMLQQVMLESIADDSGLPPATQAAIRALADRIGDAGGHVTDPRRRVARRLKQRVRRLG